MSDGRQFKSFTTRKMRADLHYRLKLNSAQRGITMEQALNEALEAGLIQMEKRVKQASGMVGV